MRVFFGKGQMGTKESTCETISDGPSYSKEFLVLTTIILHIIADHQHDLPLKDITIHQTATDARDILVGLHLLELTTQQSRRRRSCHGEMSLLLFSIDTSDGRGHVKWTKDNEFKKVGSAKGGCSCG